MESSILGGVSVRRIEYIPATAMDNPHITRDYIVELEQKPKALREALLLGKWDAFDGQAFPEFVDDPAHYEDGLFTHVIKPFKIPWHWTRVVSFDQYIDSRIIGKLQLAAMEKARAASPRSVA